jgi:hypothetical protein
MVEMKVSEGLCFLQKAFREKPFFVLLPYGGSRHLLAYIG